MLRMKKKAALVANNTDRSGSAETGAVINNDKNMERHSEKAMSLK